MCDFRERRPEAEKVAKIVNWPIPLDVTQLRAFLGLCVYFRILVEHYSWIADPLYHLLRQKVAFVWSEEQNKAFNLLKEEISQYPLVMPD